MSRPRLLLYLHGFLSSPATPKPLAIEKFLLESNSDVVFLAPQLPCLPSDTIQYLHATLAAYPEHEIGILGSSMGGYFAIHLAATYGLRAVLVNPAVQPHELFPNFQGEISHPYTGERFTLRTDDVADVLALQVPVAKKAALADRLFLLIQTGDETLDFSQASAEFAHCRCVIEYGGSHSFEGFERYLQEITAFLFP